MKTSIIKSIFFVSLITMFVSCEKNYLDVNTSPNNPLKLLPKQILPAAIGHTAYVMGNDYQILGGYWGQFWT